MRLNRLIFILWWVALSLLCGSQLVHPAEPEGTVKAPPKVWDYGRTDADRRASKIAHTMQCPGGVCPPKGPWRNDPTRPPPSYSWERGEDVRPAGGDWSNTVAKTVVKVITTEPAGGSGVSIYAKDGYGLFITARHVYGDEKRAVRKWPTRVTFLNGKTYNGSVVEFSNKADLALVAYSYPKTDEPPTAFLANKSAARGSEVWKVGYPAREDGSAPLDVRYGKVYGLKGGYLAASAQIHSGDSGGGLFDSTGHLTGIGVIAAFEHNGFGSPLMRGGKMVFKEMEAVPIESVNLFVEQCWPRIFGGGRTPRPAPRPSPPMPSDGGMPVPPSSPAPPADPKPSGESTVILSQILLRLDKIESLKAVPGPAGARGEKGEKGDAGPAGLTGAPGENGKSADETRLAAIEARIAALIKQIEADKQAAMRLRVEPAKD